MSSSIDLRPIAIPPALRSRLLRQNPGRVKVLTYDIRAGVTGRKNEFIFRVLEGRARFDGLPGIPYRVAAYVPDPGLPLFPARVGRFDYRIVRGKLAGSNATSGLNHEGGSSGDKPALRTELRVKQEFRGIGRALMSIAFNHLASEGIKTIFLHNVVNSRALRFLSELSRSARVVECYHEGTGPIPFSEANPEDEDVVINMEIDTNREDPRYMPRILITLRSKPVEEILAIQFRST